MNILTGKVRHRVKGLPHYLVLQVEERVVPKPDGPCAEFVWRDAMVQDLAFLPALYDCNKEQK